MPDEKRNISQKIINYAIWYYLKYFPSVNKMRQKLYMKFGPESEKGKKYGGIFEDDIDWIITEKLGNILVEKEIISSNIRNYIARGKNINYIKQKLSEKQFIKEDCEEILRVEFDADNVSLLDERKLFKQILTLKNKNKSRNFIRNKFIDRPLDSELVDPILDEIFLQGEDESIFKELAKMLKVQGGIDNQEIKDILRIMDYKSKQKIIQKLVGKGFSFGDIMDTLKGIEYSKFI